MNVRSNFSRRAARLARAGVLLALLCACGERPAERQPLAEGMPLPPLTLTGLDGGSVSGLTFEGRLLVLNIWASWCPPCRNEMPGLQRLSEQLDARRFAVAGLSVDRDAFLAGEFVGRYGITFENFADPGGKLSKQLGVNAYPETLLVAPDGTLIRRVIGERDWDSPAMVRMLEELRRQHRAAKDRNMVNTGERTRI